MADDRIWKPLDLIKVTADYLAGKEVPSPRLDAEVLLCEVMGLKRRVDLYAGFETEISGKELAAYREVVKRRAAREPVSRIVGHREFMGLNFKISPDVLSPRPETELLVEAALETVNPKKQPEPRDNEDAVEETPNAPEEMTSADLERLLDSYAQDVDNADNLDEEVTLTVSRQASNQAAPRAAPVGTKRPASRQAERQVRALDLGTGSGCIAVSLAAHLSGARVVAVDASPKALAVAKKNAVSAGVAERVDFRQGDWFAGCRQGESFDLILSNPPYLVEGDAEIWPEVSHYDPPLALYGGQDGLDCYRRIIPDAGDWLAPGGWIFLEVGAGQAERVAEMLSRRGFARAGIIKDYGGVGRVVKAMATD